MSQLSLFAKATKAAPARPHVREQTYQNQVITGCHLRHYITLETNEHRRPVECPKCSHRWTPPGGNGRQPGVPDVLVSHLDWPPAVWLGLECKGSHTALSARQKELRAQQRIRVAKGWADADREIRAFETWRSGAAPTMAGDMARLQSLLLEVSRRLHEILPLIETPAARTAVRLCKSVIDRALRT